MIVLIRFLQVCSLPSYFAILLFFDFLVQKLRAVIKKQNYSLDDFRFRFRNLTSKDGSKIQLAVFLCILFVTILTSPFFIDLLQIENIYLKPSGTYSYLVQYSSGDTYPAQIKKSGGQYFVEKVYLTQSAVLEYEEDENEVFIKKQSYVSRVGFSDSDKITLLNKHAEFNSITETNHVTLFYGLLLLALVASDIFAIIVYHPQKPFDPKDYIDNYIDELTNT